MFIISQELNKINEKQVYSILYDRTVINLLHINVSVDLFHIKSILYLNKNKRDLEYKGTKTFDGIFIVFDQRHIILQ